MNKTVFFVVLIATGVVISVLSFVVVFVFFVFLPHDQPKFLLPTCDSVVYCQGDLLHYAQTLAAEDEDSKYFVDLSMVEDEEVVLERFNELMKLTDNNPSMKDMKYFLAQNFVNYSDLSEWYPTDFTEEPRFLNEIVDPKVKEFAKAVVSRWKDLGRKVKVDVMMNPGRHSLIYVPHGFIVPGGRFSEYFYWDSYWIIDGLLISDMNETVKGMLENFLSLIDSIGFIPNSGRIYHIRRSQPPLFSAMVRLYYDRTKDIEWLRYNLKRIEAEAEFWENNRMVNVVVHGIQYRVAIYNATTSGPRPESYKEDLATASKCQNSDERLRLYIELKSAAESGWDFSSRWIFDDMGGRRGTIATSNVTRVAPVDLNAFLYGVFENIAYFCHELELNERMYYWRTKATDIKRAITKLMWNQNDKTWYDYDIILKRQRRYFAASNLTPLWTKAYDTNQSQTITLIHQVIGYLKDQKIMEYLGGIPATTENSGEQWDLPNNWPCLQQIIVEGLEKSGVEEGKKMAKKLAEMWITSVMESFSKDGNLYEKYDATKSGEHGGGGEYTTQIGFGWTNGVALRFIKEYYLNTTVKSP